MKLPSGDVSFWAFTANAIQMHDVNEKILLRFIVFSGILMLLFQVKNLLLQKYGSLLCFLRFRNKI